MTVADPSDDVRRAQPLPRGVLAGYAVGSLVPGAFGTVPGLLLLPYLTDTLGVAAGVAGLLVLLSKASAVAAARPVDVPPGLLGAVTPDQVTPELVEGLAAVSGSSRWAARWARSTPFSTRHRRPC
jgi:hypothetical protein